MKLADLTEARYASHSSTGDVYKQYNKLANELMYNRDCSFAMDSAARTVLVNDRVAAEIVIVANGANFDKEQAIAYTRKMLQSKGLPYTTIDADRTTGNFFVQVRYQD